MDVFKSKNKPDNYGKVYDASTSNPINEDILIVKNIKVLCDICDMQSMVYTMQRSCICLLQKVGISSSDIGNYKNCLYEEKVCGVFDICQTLISQIMLTKEQNNKIDKTKEQYKIPNTILEIRLSKALRELNSLVHCIDDYT